MWFETVFGFKEGSFDATRSKFHLENEGRVLVSDANGARFDIGSFECPSVTELHAKLAEQPACPDALGALKFDNVLGDARQLHKDPANAGAVFLAASQFNCLEMVGPNVRPEDGVTNYVRDRTQGPACALSCPGALIFRNYFVGGGGQKGAGQLDLLRDVGRVVGNEGALDGADAAGGSGHAPQGRFWTAGGGGHTFQGRFWDMQNGYAIPSGGGSIGRLSKALDAGGDAMRATAHGELRVGIHWDTEVTDSERSPEWRKTFFEGDGDGSRSGGGGGGGGGWEAVAEEKRTGHRVCQVFASALPVSYTRSRATSAEWAPFASLILAAAYDGTLAAAASLARERGERVTVFLTALGGGAFGNDSEWIASAIAAALATHAAEPLDVKLVHFGTWVDPCFRDLGGPLGVPGPGPS